MNTDLTIFKNSIGRIMKFCTYHKGTDFVFEEDFHGKLLAVAPNYLIVEQTYIRSNEQFEEELQVQKRKLFKGKFTIDTGEIHMSH